MCKAAGLTAVACAYKCPLSPLVPVCVYVCSFHPPPLPPIPLQSNSSYNALRPHSKTTTWRRDQREKRRTINYRKLFFTLDKKLFGCDKLRLKLGDFFPEER